MEESPLSGGFLVGPPGIRTRDRRKMSCLHGRDAARFCLLGLVPCLSAVDHPPDHEQHDREEQEHAEEPPGV